MERQSAYQAHISGDLLREQTVRDHLKGTAERAAAFAAAFDAAEQGRLAGMAHDIGKFSEPFQRRLRGEPVQVDHSTAGAYECCLRGQPFAAMAVAGHHAGLPDYGSETDAPDQPTFLGRMQRARRGPSAAVPAYDAFRRELELPEAALPPHAQTWTEPDVAFFTRMLYSCLVDADFMDTEAFMEQRERTPSAVTMEELIRRLDHHCAGWFPPRTPLNAKRCAVLRQCEAAGEAQAPGLFTLTIPTGGGKTVSSLAFALRHARAHGLRRVIYVLPYTSIIEQNARQFAQILGRENVLEHHSGALHDIRDEATPEEIRQAQAVENWDSPVVVTTAVQFFESLFASHPSRCRKLHNIARSVVIFDEAQMLPLPYLRPCVYAIAQLVKRYRVTAVLCTATQPALGRLFAEFLPGASAREICPGVDFDAFRRVTFARAGLLTDEELAGRLNGHEQALCIVNTRAKARAVYDLLRGEGAYHLSTLMTPAHRREAIGQIRERLRAGIPCRVVSTSLIEAGVDVDFPAVYREEAGLDSILQAAGRCNREGKRAAEASVVTIFRGEGRTPALFQAAAGAGSHVLQRYASPDDRRAIGAYFEELLDLRGKAAQDRHGIMEKLECLAFREVERHFHLIEDATRTVYVPLGEGRALVDRLRAGERSRALLRGLSQYGVSVYEQHYRALCAAGDVSPVDEGSGVLENLRLYSAQTGLSLEADAGRAEFI